jgi:hypothetical protein
MPASPLLEPASSPAAAASLPRPPAEAATVSAPAPTARGDLGTTNRELGLALRRLASGEYAAGAIQLLSFGNAQSGSALLALKVSAKSPDPSEQRATVLLLGQEQGDKPASARLCWRSHGMRPKGVFPARCSASI